MTADPYRPNPYRYVRFCAWMGPVLLVVLILGWGLLGYNIPPYAAALDAQAIADHFRQHATSVRVGMTLSMLFGVLYLVWGMAITKVMQAVERDNDVLSRLQIWGAGFTTIVLVLPSSLWLTAAFRPDVDPEILQAFYDAGWIFFDMAFSLTMLQLIAFGVCFLTDHRATPIIPKWVSWFAIWSGFMFLGFVFLPFFKDGPFSRSGMLNFWVEFSIFAWVMLAMSIYTLRALNTLQRDHANG